MGVILNRYYEIPETHMYGHDDDDRDIRDKEEYGSTIKEAITKNFQSNEKIWYFFTRRIKIR